MKLKKLIAQTENFLNAEERKRKEKRKYLKQVLKDLRAYEDKLNQRLKTETDPDIIKSLKRKKALTHEQREKGITMIKTLKKKKKFS